MVWSVNNVTIRSKRNDFCWRTLAPSVALSLILSLPCCKSFLIYSVVAQNESTGRKNIQAIGLNPLSVPFLCCSLSISDGSGLMQGGTAIRFVSRDFSRLWLGNSDCGREKTFMSSNVDKLLSCLSGFCDRTVLISSWRLKKNSGDFGLIGQLNEPLRTGNPGPGDLHLDSGDVVLSSKLLLVH